MSGSKNTELTVKYVCRSLATTRRGLRMIVLVAYSTNPTIANSTASAATSSMHLRISCRSQSIPRSSANISANGT